MMDFKSSKARIVNDLNAFVLVQDQIADVQTSSFQQNNITPGPARHPALAYDGRANSSGDSFLLMTQPHPAPLFCPACANMSPKYLTARGQCWSGSNN